jgi:hypothetical protein
MRILRTFLASLALIGGAAPALADTPEQIDQRARAVEDPVAGLALARRQIAAGDVVGALTTLEGVMLYFPQDAEARLYHAGLLCRIGDREGSIVELEDIRNEDFPDELRDEATAGCDEPGRD